MNPEMERKAIDYSRGKIAGHRVHDDQGNTIVDRGQQITDDIINRAREAGELHYLMLSAVQSTVQPGSPDFQRHLQEFRDITEGHEADFVRGEKVHRQVRDFQGNVILNEGDTVTDEQLQRAEDMGIMQDLVLAVGAPSASMEEE